VVLDNFQDSWSFPFPGPSPFQGLAEGCFPPY
jgi:hypothetical protein